MPRTLFQTSKSGCDAHSIPDASDADMTDVEITDLLFACHDPTPVDLAMVFAAANEVDMERRTRRGVELYKAGCVTKLLVTGGDVLARTRPEADLLVACSDESVDFSFGSPEEREQQGKTSADQQPCAGSNCLARFRDCELTHADHSSQYTVTDEPIDCPGE